MAGQLTIDTLKASSGVLATQNGMTGIAKAWVNFNGSTGSVNGSFNVGSVTRSGTGLYQLNFTTAMPNVNYAFAPGLNRGSGGVGVVVAKDDTAYSTTALGLRVTDFGILAIDPVSVSISIFSA